MDVYFRMHEKLRIERRNQRSSWKEQLHFPLLLGKVPVHEKHQPQHIFPQTEKQRWRRSSHLLHLPQLLRAKSSPPLEGHKEVCPLIKQNKIRHKFQPKVSHVWSVARMNGHVTQINWELKELEAWLNR